jgi:hypothetical protein
VAAVLLAWRTFFAGGGAIELLATAALVVIGHGTYTTAYFSQTNFAALLAVLLYWRRRETIGGGAWIPVAAFVKPFLAVLAVAPLVGRRWRAVAGMFACGAALLVAAEVAFGPGALLEYLTRDQLSAKPSWIYDQPTNQSLLGFVLRATDTDCDGRACVTNPLYLAGSAVVAVATAVVGFKLQRAGEEAWALSVYLLAALALYPVSQLFYSVLLLPVVLVLWGRRSELPGGAPLVAALIAIAYALAAVDWGSYTVLAFLLLWGAMVVTGAQLTRRAAAGIGDARRG